MPRNQFTVYGPEIFGIKPLTPLGGRIGLRTIAVIDDVKTILGDTLQLGDRINSMEASTPLFGSIPEFDSMAVVSVITALEDQFDFVVDDEEITVEVFETVGALSTFVEQKLAP